MRFVSRLKDFLTSKRRQKLKKRVSGPSKKKPKTDSKVNFRRQKDVKKTSKIPRHRLTPGIRKQLGRPPGSPKERCTVWIRKGLWERYKKLCYGLGLTVSEGIEIQVRSVLRSQEDQELLKLKQKVKNVT